MSSSDEDLDMPERGESEEPSTSGGEEYDEEDEDVLESDEDREGLSEDEEDGDDEDEDDDENEEEEEEEEGRSKGKKASAPSGERDNKTAKKAAEKLKKKFSKEKLEKAKEAYEKRGIIYISRIPPHMKPNKLRSLLEPYGEVGRVYLAPEDMAARKERKKKGQKAGKKVDRGKKFTEGWIEFMDKKHAKQVALMLNGQPMGGKSKSQFKYDLWNIKYLPKFKWDHLTEEIAYLRAVKDQRLAAEISAATKERDFYLQQVDKAKAIEAIKERKRKRREREGGAPPEEEEGPKRKMFFGQREAKADPVSDPAAPKVSRGVLAALAGKK